ncbi:MAG: PEP-CTERM sorting domain-containing protein [Trichormus sp.]
MVGIVPNARKDRLPRPPAPPTPTPEPLTTLGLAVGVGFGGFFRRKYSRKLN